MATGNTLCVFTPQQNEPPSANYATLDTRNQHLVLDFDPAADEAANFKAVLPRHYAGGGITVYVHYAMTSATSGTVVWDVSFERIGDGVQDIDSDGFAAIQHSGAVTVPGTSGNVDIASIAFTDGGQIDSVAVGELFRLKVSRDADSTNATDNATGDAELLAVELKET